MFRPGYIQPLDGIRSRTRWYRVLRRDRTALPVLSGSCPAP